MHVYMKQILYQNVHVPISKRISLVAVCTYCLVMISIERSKTAQKSTLEIRDKFGPRQNTVRNKIQSENFSRWSENFFFGVNFVSDYIPQLYFVCNLLIEILIYNA